MVKEDSFQWSDERSDKGRIQKAGDDWEVINICR